MPSPASLAATTDRINFSLTAPIALSNCLLNYHAQRMKASEGPKERAEPSRAEQREKNQPRASVATNGSRYVAAPSDTLLFFVKRAKGSPLSVWREIFRGHCDASGARLRDLHRAATATQRASAESTVRCPFTLRAPSPAAIKYEAFV